MRTAVAVAAVLMTAALFAQEDAFLRNEKRLSELERQLNLLRQENATLKRRIEIMSLPTTEAVNAYLEQRGLSGVNIADEHGKPLSETVERVRLSGSFSTRVEYSKNRTDLDDAGEDGGDFIYTRVDLGFYYDLNDNVTLGTRLRGSFVGGGVAGLNEPGSPASVEDIDALEVYEAYALFRDVNLFGRLGGHIPVSIQAGRQELMYGDGFVLGNDGFGRGASYDGVRLIQESGRHRVDLFWAKLVENDFVTESGAIEPTSANDQDADIAGLHTDMRPVADVNISLYALMLRSWSGSSGSPYGTVPEAEMFTVGGRLHGSVMQSLSYSVEAATQLGTLDGEDIEGAIGIKGKVRYEGLGNPYRPYLSFTGVFASGDGDPADGEMNRFSPLAQDVHNLFGGLDMFLASNLKAAGGEMGIRPAPELTLLGRYFRYYVSETTDIAGGWLAGGGAGNFLGQEWNLGLGWEINTRSRLELLYGQFKPGDFTTLEDTARRLYLSLDVAF